MNKLELDKITGLKMLTISEISEINGGTSLFHDIGYAIGWLSGEVVDAAKSFSEHTSKLSPGTLYS